MREKYPPAVAVGIESRQCPRIPRPKPGYAPLPELERIRRSDSAFLTFSSQRASERSGYTSKPKDWIKTWGGKWGWGGTPDLSCFHDSTIALGGVDASGERRAQVVESPLELTVQCRPLVQKTGENRRWSGLHASQCICNPLLHGGAVIDDVACVATWRRELVSKHGSKRKVTLNLFNAAAATRSEQPAASEPASFIKWALVWCCQFIPGRFNRSDCAIYSLM